MNKNKYVARALSLLLVLMLAIPIFSITASSTEAAEPKPLDGKKISILGDSISTFTNISSGIAAQTSNSTIANNRVFYNEGKNGVGINDTWWMQVMNKLGGELLVNNSYSRSTVFDPNDDKAIQGYYERCINLHDNTGDNDGEKPDVILIYMGVNDFSYCRETLGVYESIDFNALINGGSYTEPTSTCEAYAIMLHKITTRYQDAEVYCFTLPAKKNFVGNEEAIYLRFNSSISKLAEHFGCYVVDTYNDSGVVKNKLTNEMYLADGVHPNKNGMTAIANSFINSFYANSRYAEGYTLCNVDYVLSDAIADNGLIKKLPAGSDLSCSFSAVNGAPLDITVLSDGRDISDNVVINDSVHIPNLTTDIKIIVSPESSEECYGYSYVKDENDTSVIINQANDEFTENRLISHYDEASGNVYHEFDKTIALRHTEAWSIVWETIYDGCEKPLAFYNYSDIQKENNTFIRYDSETTLLSIGIYKHGSYCDYGIKLSDYGIDTSVSHSYRLSNVLEPLSNTVYLYVDGRRIAPMIYCYVNGNKFEQDYNRWNGKDLYINYVGCNESSVSLDSVIDISVWEGNSINGHIHELIYTHSYELTCTEDERTEHVCKCGYTETDVITTATGHTPSDVAVTTVATEHSDGCGVIQCTVCGATLESVVIPQITVPTYVKVISYICVLFIPLIMIIIGIAYVKKKKLSKPNMIVGYRTTLSMKNEDTWSFANRLMGKISLIVGIIALVASALILIPFINTTEDRLTTAMTVITLVQTLILVLSIIPVEVKLRKTFDKDGNRLNLQDTKESNEEKETTSDVK